MTLVIVYVGAVAVLFLFVVMMLDVDFAALREGLQRYAPVGAVIGAILLLELLLVFGTWTFATDSAALRLNPTPGDVENTRALGRIMYTDYVFLFQAAGLILLVAMIGAIVLTLRGKPTSRRQDVTAQVARSGSVNLRQPAAGRGACGRQAEAGRARRPSRGAPLMMAVGLAHYLTVSAILLTLGVLGIFLNRKNIIVILMSVELILLSVSLNLVAFSARLGDLTGQVFAMLILTVAAAEAAIGLAIVVIYFRNRGTIEVDDVSTLKG
jgi:NADH:ubiquinone oxidoreductase subunit K